jgi:hypothetical protein
VEIDLRTLQALGWGEPPTNKIFIHEPTPRSNFCLLAHAQFSKHTPPFGRLDPVGLGSGWALTNIICMHIPTPRSNFCLLAPAQFFTLQGFSDGVTTGGTPGGQHLGSPPGSVLSHTHTHILSSLNYRFRKILGWGLVVMLWVQTSNSLCRDYFSFTIHLDQSMEQKN